MSEPEADQRSSPGAAMPGSDQQSGQSAPAWASGRAESITESQPTRSGQWDSGQQSTTRDQGGQRSSRPSPGAERTARPSPREQPQGQQWSGGQPAQPQQQQQWSGGQPAQPQQQQWSGGQPAPQQQQWPGGQSSGQQWSGGQSPVPQGPGGAQPYSGGQGGYGASTDGPPQLAEVGSRFVALLLDGLINSGAILVVVLVAVLLGWLLSAIRLGFIAVILGIVLYGAVFVGVFLYAVFTNAAPYGQSIGMKIAGVRIVGLDGQPIPRSKAFVRVLVQNFLSGFFLLGYLWALWDDERRTWHDIIADTRVITAPKPGPPIPALLKGAFKGERVD